MDLSKASARRWFDRRARSYQGGATSRWRAGVLRGSRVYDADPMQASPLEPGTPAPDFALPSTLDGQLGPGDRSGRPLILVFYPADWSPVCTDQLTLYQEVMPEFEKHDAALFGISVDGRWCHLAFANDRNLRFPLLADFEPKGGVARTYGVYRTQDGTSERALFVIDP